MLDFREVMHLTNIIWYFQRIHLSVYVQCPHVSDNMD